MNTKLTMSTPALQVHMCPALLCAMSHLPGASPHSTQALASASVHAPQRRRGQSICAAMTLRRCPRLAAHRHRNPGQPRAPGSPTHAGLASFRTNPARTQIVFPKTQKTHRPEASQSQGKNAFFSPILFERCVSGGTPNFLFISRPGSTNEHENLVVIDAVINKNRLPKRDVAFKAKKSHSHKICEGREGRSVENFTAAKVRVSRLGYKRK